MSKKIIAVLSILVILVLSCLACGKPDYITVKGNVSSTYLYTSDVTFNGITYEAYTTKVFLDNGYSFRIVGKYDIPLGVRTFKLYPDKYGATWNGVKSIE